MQPGDFQTMAGERFEILDIPGEQSGVFGHTSGRDQAIRRAGPPSAGRIEQDCRRFRSPECQFDNPVFQNQKCPCRLGGLHGATDVFMPGHGVGANRPAFLKASLDREKQFM